MSDWTSPDATPPQAPPPPAAPPPPPATGGPPPASGWSGGRRIPLRPMRFGEMLDAAFKLYRLTFVQVAVLVVLTLGVFTVLQIMVQPAAPGFTADPAEFDAFFDELGTGLLFSVLIGIFVQLFVYPIVRGGVTGIALEADRGGDTSWQAGLRTAWRLAGPLVALGLLLFAIGIGVALALLVLIGGPIALLAAADAPVGVAVVAVLAIPVVAVVVLAMTALLYLTVPILVVERVGPFDAIRRSAALVRPQLLRVAGLVFITGVLAFLVSGVLGVFSVPFSFLGGTVAQVATTLLTLATLVVTIPFQANVALLLYVDARVRAEGLDVAVLTAELDQL